MSSYKICNYCGEYEHDCKCLAAKRIAKLEQQSRADKELIEKLVTALSHEYIRIGYGHSLPKDFYEKHCHFGWCSKQYGDPRRCSVCCTAYEIHDVLQLVRAQGYGKDKDKS